jgi:menaquinone-9 beta-reductase
MHRSVATGASGLTGNSQVAPRYGIVCPVRRVDIAVVGSGPAGAAAATVAARTGLAVLLVDRLGFPRDKACGDGIGGHVLDELREIGRADVLVDRRPTWRLELGTSTDSSTRPLRTPIWGVPRWEFDRRLHEAAVAARAEFLRHTVRRLAVEPDRVVLDDQIAAGVVIAADGVESVVRRQLAIPLNGPVHTAIAIRGYTPALSDRARLVAFGRDWPAYAWEFPLGDGTSNVGYGEVLRPGKHLTREHLLGRLDELMPGATAGARDWRAARIPLSTRRPYQPDGRVLLAGDAASLVNPMSGEGIWYAIKSGILAGQAAAHGPEAGRVYRESLGRTFDRNLRHANLMARGGRIGSMPSFGTRMTVVDEDFFHDQVGVSIGGGTYRWPIVARAMLRAVRQRHPGRVDVSTAATAGPFDAES